MRQCRVTAHFQRLRMAWPYCKHDIWSAPIHPGRVHSTGGASRHRLRGSNAYRDVRPTRPPRATYARALRSSWRLRSNSDTMSRASGVTSGCNGATSPTAEPQRSATCVGHLDRRIGRRVELNHPRSFWRGWLIPSFPALCVRLPSHLPAKTAPLGCLCGK